MKNFKYFIPIAFLSIISCGDKKETIHNVNYYFENDKERKEKITFCKESINNKSINCANAMEAKSRIATKNILGSGIKRSKTN